MNDGIVAGVLKGWEKGGLEVLLLKARYFFFVAASHNELCFLCLFNHKDVVFGVCIGSWYI